MTSRIFRPGFTPYGFTLVEMAIVLTIIGLVVGGVLQGREIIENTKVTRTIAQVSLYGNAAIQFRNTYGALPGDIKAPGTRLDKCTDACAAGGNLNGQIDPLEGVNFWIHMQRANLLSAYMKASTSPLPGSEQNFLPTPLGGYFVAGLNQQGLTIQDDGADEDIYSGGITGITPKQAFKIDQKMDDGLPTTGNVRSTDLIDSSPDGKCVTSNAYNKSINNFQSCRIVFSGYW